MTKTIQPELSKRIVGILRSAGLFRRSDWDLAVLPTFLEDSSYYTPRPLADGSLVPSLILSDASTDTALIVVLAGADGPLKDLRIVLGENPQLSAEAIEGPNRELAALIS